MRDHTTELVVKELTEAAFQYLCERDFREMCDEIDALFPSGANFDRANFAREPIPWNWRPPARKRGRPQRHDRHLQIAGAVAMVVEDAGIRPTRSHLGRRRQRDPSACSIVAAALERMRERLDERTVEGIWNRFRRSPLTNHVTVRDWIGIRYGPLSLIIR
jgi:hypothetical protein